MLSLFPLRSSRACLGKLNGRQWIKSAKGLSFKLKKTPENAAAVFRTEFLAVQINAPGVSEIVALLLERLLHTDLRKPALSLIAFPMFVPSLSW